VTNKKIIWTIIIAIVLSLSLVPTTRNILFESHIFSFVDQKATQYVDESLQHATAAFVLARTFNAIVSVFQESELQLEPGGIGVTLALGQALDPINDIVERFSWVMLTSLTSLGIQKFLIEISPFVSIRIMLLLALLSFLIGLWLPLKDRNKFKQFGQTILISSIILRFAVPAMAYMNQQVYVAFLEDSREKSMNALVMSASEMEGLDLNKSITVPETEQDNPDSATKSGWWNRTKDKINQTVHQGMRLVDIKSELESIKKLTVEIIDKIINLIVVFVLSSIVLPLLFLWGIFKFGRLIIDRSFGVAAEEWFIKKTGFKDI